MKYQFTQIVLLTEYQWEHCIDEFFFIFNM
jgi:hypothetical protein